MELCYIPREGKLKSLDILNDSHKNVYIDWIDEGTGLILIGEDLFLTGGYRCSNGSAVIGTKTSDLESLNSGRCLHAMGIFAGRPGVVGGYLLGTTLDSVEIWDGDRWIEAPSLHYKRKQATCANANGNVYVIGGIDREWLNSIEVWNGEEWEIAELRLFKRLFGIAAITLNDEIIVFGGVDTNSHENKTVWKFDFQNGIRKRLKNMNDTASFYNNQCLVTESTIYFLDTRNKVVQYPLSNI